MKVKLYTLLLLLIFLIACAPTSTSQSPHPLRTLIVYSPYPSHLIRPILNDFEKREHVKVEIKHGSTQVLLSNICLLYTSPSPRDATLSRMPSSA